MRMIFNHAVIVTDTMLALTLDVQLNQVLVIYFKTLSERWRLLNSNAFTKRTYETHTFNKNFITHTRCYVLYCGRVGAKA
jgi:hypothetical protein